MSTMWRSRWAAVGAAVAVTLGAGSIGLVNAAKSSGERAVYTAIEPCRLLDTRPNQNIQRNTPLGPAETYAVSAIGSNGQCTGIPADTVALEMNVTGLLNTAATDFVIWGGAGDPPNASQLNLALGAPPTPNSVTTELDGNSFSIRNKFGNAHVIVDIVGIYQDHNHDDRYYTETESDGRFLQSGTPIVMQHGTGQATPNYSSLPTLVKNYASGSLISADGGVNIGLVGPATIGGIEYGLSSVEYCVRQFSGGAYVNRVQIWENSSTTFNNVSDDTNRNGPGCYTLDVNMKGAQAYDLFVLLAGGGQLRLSGVQSTWLPVSQIPSADVFDGAGGPTEQGN